MATEKFKVSTQLLSYVGRQSTNMGKTVPYINVNGLICRTQGKISPDADGNVIGEVTVEKVAKGDVLNNGVAAKADSYTLIDFTPRSLSLKSKEYDYREAELGFRTTILARKSAEAGTLVGHDLFAITA